MALFSYFLSIESKILWKETYFGVGWTEKERTESQLIQYKLRAILFGRKSIEFILELLIVDII